MAIRNTDPNVEFGYIYMRELTIAQSRITNVSDYPIYTVSIAWDFYKVVEGAIIYDPASVNTDYIEDFYSIALDEYMSGDSTKMNGLGANQLVVSQLISELTGLALEVI